VGLAIIATPAIMGALADEFGLRFAHLVLPILVVAGLACFLLAQALERRQTATI
jgi:predicted MFS family arabinose efflux permease